MWYLIIGLGWIWYRQRQGLPILPDFLSGKKHPFAAGAVLVPTGQGIVAVPADTPAMHPAVAMSQGFLSPNATASLSQAIAASKTVMDQSAGGALLGSWAMFDNDAGAGPDVYVNELGIPRSNSMASRRWGVR